MIVAFIGHRKIKYTRELEHALYETIANLIVNENADTFLFGSKSEFDNICYQVVTELKDIYKHIRRIYVRAEYEYIDESYTEYILQSYEETYFPIEINGAGRLSYIKRNEIMVDSCNILVTYCNESYQPEQKKCKTASGTKLAVNNARKKEIRIINIALL